jgi:branched-chain amino acid transport system ATP-binding protein
VLEVHALNTHYGKIHAVRDMTLGADPGRITLILGANGAGKTTTLRTISGLVPATSGSVLLEGNEILGLPTHKIVKSGLSIVPEGRQILGALTVEENLRLGGYVTDKSARRKGLASAFEMFPILYERRRSPAGLLSGGEQQMLAFSRALMSSPRVLLLDEPSMGLSPAMVDAVFEKVRDIADLGIAVLMVEQNVEVGMSVADQVVMIARGETVFSGPADVARSNQSVLLAFLGEAALVEES